MQTQNYNPPQPHVSCGSISRFSRPASKPFPHWQNLFPLAWDGSQTHHSPPSTTLARLSQRWDGDARPQDRHGAGGEQHPEHPKHAVDFTPHYRHGLDFVFPISSMGSTRRDGKTHTSPPVCEARVTLGTAMVTNPLPCPPPYATTQLSLQQERKGRPPLFKNCLSLKK